MDFISAQFSEAQQVLNEFSQDENFALIQLAGDLMITCLKNGGKIISCGNGGSMSDAMHFAEELSGNYRENRPAWQQFLYPMQDTFLVLPMIMVTNSFFLDLLKPWEMRGIYY